MTGYTISDSSNEEVLDKDSKDIENPKWFISLHMTFEHLDLNEEKLKAMHRLFKYTMKTAEEIMEK